MRLSSRARFWRHAESPAPVPARWVDIRITDALFAEVRLHVENFTRGEEVGFLICSANHQAEGDALLAREFMPLPDHRAGRYTAGSVVSWPAEFLSQVMERALALHATAILMHSHGAGSPTFSEDDKRHEGPLLGPFSRMLDPLPTGAVVLGAGAAAGSFWQSGQRANQLRRIVVLGDTIETIWGAGERPDTVARRRLTRQSGAIGADSDAQLAFARVAVLGLSGGGSHVIQQLAHQGVGSIMPVDDEVVDESNLGRVVGATEADADVTPKTDLAERIICGIDSTITTITVPERFPSSNSIDALKAADVIVTCVDSFRTREAANALSRRYLIPHVDIGLNIRTVGGRLALADGQLVASLPGRPCLRCTLITDAVLEQERRERPPGYDLDPDSEGDPQVVSMNGVLASEACNCVLDLLVGFSGGRRGARWWGYNGVTGQLCASDIPAKWPECPACAEEGLGDPSPHRE